MERVGMTERLTSFDPAGHLTSAEAMAFLGHLACFENLASD
jgi:hypothetical protein